MVEKIMSDANTNYDDEDMIMKYFEEYTYNQCKYICSEYPTKRILTYKVYDNLDSVGIVFISGIRRIGKSVLLAQICDKLISQGKRSIIIDAQLLGKKFKDYDDYYSMFTWLKANRYDYVFLDEICKIPDASYFGNTIRNFSHSLKFVLTGSSKVGVEKVHDSAGRGALYTLTDWTYLEKLVMKNANNLNNCPYKFNQLEELTSIVTKDSVEDFLYYNESKGLVSYIKSCIDDTLESNIRRHYPIINNLRDHEIKAVLELISYSQILELDDNLSSIISVNYFSKLHSYIMYKVGTDYSNNMYGRPMINNILNNTSPFEHNVNNILNSIGKDRISNILTFLLSCGLIDIQVKYSGSKQSLTELIRECKFSQLTIFTKHRALTINIFKRALNIVLDGLNVHIVYPTNSELMTDERLNLKGDLLESYIYSIMSNLLSDSIVTKYRDEYQREVDLLICKDIKFGLEIKNRRTSNNSNSYIRKQLALRDELKLRSFAITTTDETSVHEGMKFINMGELMAYLDSLILETNEDTVIDNLCNITKIN